MTTNPDHRPAPAGAPAIELAGLGYAYGENPVLRDLSLTVAETACHALLGRNGAGKTTLLRCLLGLLRPRGSARVLGLDPWRQHRAVVGHVGFVPEQPHVPPAMRLDEAGRFTARLTGGSFRRDRFERMVAAADLDPRQRFRSLSRGQKTLAALALELASEPRLLLLDDPTLGLDGIARRRIWSLLADVQAETGATVLLATHDLDAVDGIATDVTLLDAGRVVVSGSVDDLRTRFRTVDLRPRETIDGVVGVVESSALGRRVLVRRDADGGLAGAGAPPRIEEVFVAFLGAGSPACTEVTDARRTA